MEGTPEDLQARIRAYYVATTDSSYLASWSPEALGVHFGMDGEEVRTHEQSLANTNRFLADALALSGDDRCLDAGCGVGGTAIWVALHRGAAVVGVNIADNQVAHARRFAEARGAAARTEFLVRDYAATNLDPGGFDVVWNLESLCHAADPRATLKHLYDLLRPGGRYACLDFFRGDRGDPKHVRDLCEGWVLPAFMSRREATEAVQLAGFEVARSVDVTPRVLRSASTLIAMAGARKSRIDLERALTGATDPIYEGHTLAALGCARGFYDGAVTYGLVVGVKPAVTTGDRTCRTAPPGGCPPA